jgi:hypothetical protein
MTYERFQIIAGEVARNDIMGADERNNALAHAGVCEGCRQVLTLQSRLSEDLGSLAQEMKAVEAPNGLDAKVLVAFRQQIRQQTRVQSFSASRSRRPYWAAAAAAVVLLAIGLSAWRWFAFVPQRTEQVSTKNSAPNVAGSNSEKSPDVAISTIRPSNPPTPLTPRKVQSRRHSTTQVAKLNVRRSNTEASLPAKISEPREITTDFVPVGYGSALDLQEGGQLVRVELPRSALARFGLPMNMNRADEKITADVLVGADGLARAIRFVQAINEPTTGLKPEMKGTSNE